MEDETKSVADFLNNLSESPELFKEAQAAAEETEPEEKEDKPLAFHKDPKVQRYVQKEIEKAMKDVKPAEAQFKKDVEDINLPDSFVRLVGNDTPEKLAVLKDLSSYFSTLKGEAKQDFLREIEEQKQQQASEEAQSLKFLEDSFEEIEETYGVDLNASPEIRSKFIDYVKKVAPKDENGEVKAFPDMLASFEEFQEKSKRIPVPQTRAKELASRGMARSGDTTTTVPQGRSWKDVDRYFEKLKATN